MSLHKELAELAAAQSTAAKVNTTPKGWEPGIVYEPNGSQVVTLPATSKLSEPEYEQALADMGIKVPDGYRIRLAELKFDPAAWTRDDPDQDKAVTKAVWRYRFVVEVAPRLMDVTELLRSIPKRKAAPKPTEAEQTFTLVIGDLQIGKPDGDGTEGTVRRFYESLERSVTRYKHLRKRGVAGDVFLAVVGDCPEGTQSQGGNLVGRLDLTLTEQIRVLRRLFSDAVSEFANLSESVTVASVPGNHGDALRVGNQVASSYNDNWDIEALVQVADVMEAKGYDHVKWLFPGHDEMHLVADVAGTRVGLLHGHQVRGKLQQWLANKAMSRDAIGTSDIVLNGHYHHLRIEQMGLTTSMQTGSLDGGSVWWAHKGGLDAPPAAITFTTANGTWNNLEIV